MTLADIYALRYERLLAPAAHFLEQYLRDLVADCPRIERISTRAKSIDRFLKKADALNDDESPKYDDPLNQIQDQLGARIATYYLSDIPTIEATVLGYFHAIEEKEIVPDNDSEFGYEGKHYILMLPTDIVVHFSSDPDLPQFFELQIKTLFQHAWAEAEHDLGYKPPIPLTQMQKRKIAFTAAQAWGADRIFDELHKEISGKEFDSKETNSGTN